MLTEAFREIPCSKSVGVDGYTLYNEGASSVLAGSVERSGFLTRSPSNDTEDDTDSDDDKDSDDNDLSMIRIPQDKVKYVIAKDGNTIRELQRESNTILNKYVFRERGQGASSSQCHFYHDNANVKSKKSRMH